MSDETQNEAQEPEKTTTVFIPVIGFRKSVPLGLNGQITELQTGANHDLTDAQMEALENSNVQFEIVNSSEGTSGGAEGSAPSGVLVNEAAPGDRTEPHQGIAFEGSALPATPPGTQDADGNPVLIGGDEPDPKDHSNDPAPAPFVPENPQGEAEKSSTATTFEERKEEGDKGDNA